MISHFEALNAKSSSTQFAAPLEDSLPQAAARPLSIFIAHPSHFLTDNKPSGDGLVAYDFIHQLAMRGHRLHIAVAEMDLQFELPANVKLYPIKTRFSSNSIIWRLEYARAVRKLFETIAEKTQIDLIHQLNPVVTGLSLFLGNTGHPLILGPYVPYWSQSSESPADQLSLKKRLVTAVKDRILTKVSHRQQKLADALLVSTPAALVKMPNSPEVLAKTHVLPYSIDINYFSPAKNVDESQSQNALHSAQTGAQTAPKILFLANLRYQKGIYTLLDAFEIIAQQHPTCQLTIAGSGQEEAEIKRRIATMQANERISLVGNVERSKIPEALRACTVYCLPSYGEPFGMTALEAMACGKPIVATDVGGLSYIVSEQGGRKVPAKDAAALAAALLEIVRSPALQVQMGQYNRQKAVQEYSPMRIVQRLENIYQQVLDENQN